MEGAADAAGQIVAKQINRDKLVKGLSEHKTFCGRVTAYVPNQYEEPQNQEEDDAVTANAEPLEVLGRILTIRYIASALNSSRHSFTVPV